MFDIINITPFSSAAGLVFDNRGANIISLAVRGSFLFEDNWMNININENQVSPLFSETYFDTAENSGIRFPADIIPGKLNTDVGLNGFVYKRNPKLKKIKASLKIGKNFKEIIAAGDRWWEKSLLSTGGYSISSPEPFIKMPIECSRLFGGKFEDKKNGIISFEPNPNGTGFINDKKNAAQTKLPNFEIPEKEIKSWKDNPLPASFGFATPAWPHRKKLSGTYDENWRKNHCPLYPEDMDMRFFNSAQPELITDGFLKGGESVELINLTQDGYKKFKIPEYKIMAGFYIENREVLKKADLHTITIEPEDNALYLTWGCFFQIGNRPTDIEYIKTWLEEDNNE